MARTARGSSGLFPVPGKKSVWKLAGSNCENFSSDSKLISALLLLLLIGSSGGEGGGTISRLKSEERKNILFGLLKDLNVNVFAICVHY